MFRLFNKEKSKAQVEAEVKSVKDIIQEIHESFYTEVDRLLAEAKITKSDETDKQALLDKAHRLEMLGFKNTAEKKEASAEQWRITLIRSENELKDKLVKAINYFSFKYPNYKFITEDSVKKICEKYNLVYGPVSKYIGTVPDKNLKQIEDFKIQEMDECYLEGTSNRSHTQYRNWQETIRSKVYQDEFHRQRRDYSMGGLTLDNWTMSKAPLEIAAPLKDFNMTASEVRNFKISEIEIPDPVVLQPVLYEGAKYYLIVTAWGDEASDELVVNEKNN